ncbi:MAG: ATP-dependent RNA helicase HrpA [Aestuariibacter sp.]
MQEPLTRSQLFSLIDGCLLKDRHAFRLRAKKIKNFSESDTAFAALTNDIIKSANQVQQRANTVPDIEYPDLPVSTKKDDIIAALRSHQVVIVAGETGSGKTTQLPKICLEAGFGRAGTIGHTQPRRLAARSVAARIAEELKSQIGATVGFKIRFSDQVSDMSLVKLMTDGILLAEIQEDRFLNQYEVLIIDEAHERSLNIDFILGYLKTLLPKRPDLKVIITSATIDPERFSKHFDDAPMLQIEGRSYPVEVRYRPLQDENNDIRDQNEAILDAVHELNGEGQGDILVFLSGEREIRDCAEFLNRAKLRHTDILPLYARLSSSEQNRIFQSHSGRRIVLSTNVAETSLTVPGIRYVIDTGTARISRYSVRSKVQRLPIEAISQASANQRAGRCGRVAAGVCIRLYDEQDYLSRPEFTDPEILRTNLASVILQLTSLRMGNIEDFPFVQPPEGKHIADGIKLLEELEAVKKAKNGLRLTNIGRSLSRLPVDPRYGRMIAAAQSHNCLREVIIITAGLSIQDPRERPREAQQKADECHQQWHDEDSDFIALLNLWQGFRAKQNELSGNQLRRWCKDNFINYLRMREWQDIVSQLKQSVVQLSWRLSQQNADYDAIHQALVSGLLSHAGIIDTGKEYLGARNMRFYLFPGSPLFKKSPKWVVAAELVETSKLYARTIAKIQPQWLEIAGQHLCKYRYAEPYWSKKAGACKAQEFATLLGLPIVNKRNVLYTDIDPVACRQMFIRDALVEGETKLTAPFLQDNLALIANVETMEEKTRRRDILVDEEELEQFYDALLPKDIATEVSFKKWWRNQSSEQKNAWHFTEDMLIKDGAQSVTDYEYPDTWTISNMTLPLSYEFEPGKEDDGVSLHIPLSVLNQIEDTGFDWLVPGFIEDKAIALIKGLPKAKRRNFVPAPDYAKAAISDIQPQDGEFLACFAGKLTKMSGVVTVPEDFEQVTLPEHLQFNFKIVEKDKVVGQSRNLDSLKTTFKSRLKKALKKVAKPGLEKEKLQNWDVGELPSHWQDNHSEFAVIAYPAMQKDGVNVHLKLFDSEHKAQAQHVQGVTQLIINQLPSPTKYLHEKLPNKAKLGLYFNPFGQIKPLINDIIFSVVLHRVTEYPGRVANEDSFKQLLTEIKTDLNEQTLEAAKIVEQGLTKAHSVSKKLKGNTPLNMINAYANAKSHLESLVYPGFVSDFGVMRLNDWARYVEALVKRVEKIPIDPNKDRLNQLTLDKLNDLYQAKLKKIPSNQAVPEELQEVRWQIEELKVSLFAQQLGTNMPISSKRVENYLDKF